MTLEDLGRKMPEFSNVSEDYLLSLIDPNIPLSIEK